MTASEDRQRARDEALAADIRERDSLLDYDFLRLSAEALSVVSTAPMNDDLRSQLYRAVLSAPSNYAEGVGRGRHTRSCVNHLVIARASLYEAKAQSFMLDNEQIISLVDQLVEFIEYQLTLCIRQ